MQKLCKKVNLWKFCFWLPLEIIEVFLGTAFAFIKGKTNKRKEKTMYTEKKHPGRFEGCESTAVGQALWNAKASDSVRNTDCDWYGLFKGHSFWFIAEVDSRGYVQYVYGNPDVIEERWNKIKKLFAIKSR